MSWEWWNGAVPYGPDVNFRAGNNYDTYAYFIDSAAKYGIEYIKFDLNSDLCTIPGDPNLCAYFAGYRRFLAQLRQRHPGKYGEDAG